MKVRLTKRRIEEHFAYCHKFTPGLSTPSATCMRRKNRLTLTANVKAGNKLSCFDTLLKRFLKIFKFSRACVQINRANPVHIWHTKARKTGSKS